jgi:tetratricopeptide (TPR) repeat protein
MAAYETFYGNLPKAIQLLKAVSIADSIPNGDLQYRIPLLQSSTYLRNGNWDASEFFGRRALQVARQAGDLVQQATALNNLACGAMEHGEWERADEHFAAVEKLYTSIHAAFDATLPLLMNRANLQFYRGNVRSARDLYLECQEISKTQGVTEFDHELHACIGLTSLQLGDVKSARESWRALISVAEEELSGIQERFKVEWFRHYLMLRTGLTGVADRLAVVAASYDDSDTLQASKLRWLASLLSTRGHVQGKEIVSETEMQESGLRWFCFFTRRWLRSANQARVR